VLKWVGTAACGVLIVAWTVSLQFNIWSQVSSRYLIAIVGGCLLLEKVPPGQGSGVWPQARPAGPLYWWPELNRAVYIQKTHWEWYMRVPIWCFLGITAVPTIWLWYRDRRRLSPDHCQHCGYNLTGNVSGTCPECGTTIEHEGRPA